MQDLVRLLEDVGSERGLLHLLPFKFRLEPLFPLIGELSLEEQEILRLDALLPKLALLTALDRRSKRGICHLPFSLKLLFLLPPLLLSQHL